MSPDPQNHAQYVHEIIKQITHIRQISEPENGGLMT